MHVLMINNYHKKLQGETGKMGPHGPPGKAGPPVSCYNVAVY